MRLASRVVSPFVRWVLGAICRVDSSELAKVPRKGPLILVMNHINFLEVPLVYVHLFPRRLAGVVKRETWKNPLMAFLGNVWEAIPLDRTGTDLLAMRKMFKALENGWILLLAPEGTRSGDGKLGPGHGGVVQVALHSGVPIIPIVHFGGEKFWANLKSWRRTRFTFRVGEPFRLKMPEGSLTRQIRKEMTAEIMDRIALLLPPAYRGLYPSPELRVPRHLDFDLAGKP